MLFFLLIDQLSILWHRFCCQREAFELRYLLWSREVDDRFFESLRRLAVGLTRRRANPVVRVRRPDMLDLLMSDSEYAHCVQLTQEKVFNQHELAIVLGTRYFTETPAGVIREGAGSWQKPLTLLTRVAAICQACIAAVPCAVAANVPSTPQLVLVVLASMMPTLYVWQLLLISPHCIVRSAQSIDDIVAMGASNRTLNERARKP